MNGNIMSDIGPVFLTHIYSVSFVIKLISQMLALVLLHVTVVEIKESFIMTGHAFIQHFIHNEEPLVQSVIRHHAISASLHMRSPFSFSFQSD